ncbi:hypothetical protein BGZ74_008024 [Mortierella antarctica]|nr:hypothetical protein BGZ74_008024 [Mortierella antarctica]
MLGNNPTSNNAIRFGAAILLGTAIAYLIWSASSSSSSSSSSQKTEKKEVKKTTKTVTSEKKTEVKKGNTIKSEPTVEAAAEATVETTIERTIGRNPLLTLAHAIRHFVDSVQRSVVCDELQKAVSSFGGHRWDGPLWEMHWVGSTTVSESG